MADESIWKALRNLAETVVANTPHMGGRRKIVLEVGITLFGGVATGLLTSLFPNRVLQALTQMAGFSVTAVTSNLFIVSLLLLVLYNQRRMRQSREETRPRPETDGGTASGDPVAFFVGATIGALIGSQYFEGGVLAMAIIGSGFVLYEWERAQS